MLEKPHFLARAAIADSGRMRRHGSDSLFIGREALEGPEDRCRHDGISLLSSTHRG